MPIILPTSGYFLQSRGSELGTDLSIYGQGGSESGAGTISHGKGAERFGAFPVGGSTRTSGRGKNSGDRNTTSVFSWPRNAHSYSWSTQVSDEASKFRLIRQFADGLSECGVNLLIIDNLTTCDHGLVPIYNRLILEREGEPKGNQTVLVVYVFNLETNLYWEQFELLQELPAETTIVNFRFFNEDDLLDCLASELKRERRILTSKKESFILQEAMKTVHSSGCKSLRLLLLQNGTNA